MPDVRLCGSGSAGEASPACLSLLDDTEGVPRSRMIRTVARRRDILQPEVPSMLCRALATAGTRLQGALTHGERGCCEVALQFPVPFLRLPLQRHFMHFLERSCA